MCIVFTKGEKEPREVGPASGFSPLAGKSKPKETGKPARDSSGRNGIVPTGRGNRKLIRGNTGGWR